MCCGDCSRLRRLIIANKNNPIERDKLQNEFLAHVEKQQIYRDIYECGIKKSVSRKHGKYCISMILDAAGGMRFYPRFKTMEKSEAIEDVFGSANATIRIHLITMQPRKRRQ